jgi:hypothetical protein
VTTPPAVPPSTPRRARHLIDFDKPAVAPQPGAMTLTQVQRWVLSVLAVTTIFHLSAGLVVAAFYVDATRTGAGVGLLVIAGLFGVLAVVAGLGIHGHRLLSGWLLLGWVPTLVGAYLMFGR